MIFLKNFDIIYIESEGWLMMSQREYDDNKSKYGIIDKSEMTKLVEAAHEAMEQERQMRQRLIDMYERQLKIQDAEIQRLQAAQSDAQYWKARYEEAIQLFNTKLEECKTLKQRVAELESNPRAKYASDFEESVANGWVYG